MLGSALPTHGQSQLGVFVSNLEVGLRLNSFSVCLGICLPEFTYHIVLF